MLDKKMEQALNDQINAELFSAYLYLSMSADFEARALKGFANWMRVQAQEEVVHAMKLYTFILERGGRVSLVPIDGPPKKWKTPLAAFENTLSHEQEVTRLINKLVDLSLQLRDHATGAFLQWFVNEQVEEESSADEILQQLKLVGGDGHALLLLDRELGTRTFVMPPAAGEAGAA